MIGYMIQLLVFSCKYILFCVGNLDLALKLDTDTIYWLFLSFSYLYYQFRLALDT